MSNITNRVKADIARIIAALIIITLIFAAAAVTTEPATAAGPILISKSGRSPAQYQAAASATCPTNRACVWSGYWDAADQGSLWYYTYAQLQAGVSWEGTAADLSTSSWYNRLTPIGTAGAPYMLMATNASCSTTSGRYVRLASQQVANGRNPATNWDNAYRSVFTQPPSAC